MNCISIASIRLFSHSFHSSQVPKFVLAEMHALKNKQTNVFHWIYDSSINRQLFRLCFIFVLRSISVTMKLYITLQVNIDCLPNLPCIKIMPRTSFIIFKLPMVLEFTLIIAAGFCESCFNFAFFRGVLQALKVGSRFFLKKSDFLWPGTSFCRRQSDSQWFWCIFLGFLRFCLFVFYFIYTHKKENPPWLGEFSSISMKFTDKYIKYTNKLLQKWSVFSQGN